MSHRPLTAFPVCDGAGFLKCEGWKNKLWKPGLPRDGFGFVERLSKEARLPQEPLEVGEQNPGFGRDIRRVNQSGGLSVANRCFKILPFVVQNLLNLLLQPILPGADFRAQRKEWTTEHTPEFRFDFGLKTIAVVTASATLLQRRNGW